MPKRFIYLEWIGSFNKCLIFFGCYGTESIFSFAQNICCRIFVRAAEPETLYLAMSNISLTELQAV